MGETEDAYTLYLGLPWGGNYLGSSRRRCEDNIKMVLREIMWKNVD
jgi:hypothetical protein